MALLWRGLAASFYEEVYSDVIIKRRFSDHLSLSQFWLQSHFQFFLLGRHEQMNCFVYIVKAVLHN